MPKYVNYQVAGYWLYYTSSCLNEGIVHVHANKPTTVRKGSTKILVHSDGTSTVVEPTNIRKSDLLIIQNWIYANFELICTTWNSYGLPYDFKHN